MTHIRIGFVTAHTLWAQTLSRALERLNRPMQVTSVVIADGAASFDPAIVQSDELNGVIISLDLPVRSDLSIIRMLRTSEYQGPLMLLCAHYDLPVLDELVEYQVSGIVSSESSLEELEAALYAVLDQQPETLTRQYLKMARTIVRLPTPETLTRRELEILRLVATGLTDGEIAERLNLNPKTVSSHLYRTYAKLGTHSRTGAVAVAIKQGLLKL